MDNFRFTHAGATVLLATVLYVPGSLLTVSAQTPGKVLVRPDLAPELRLDESRRVVLTGNTPAIVRAGIDMGPVDGGLQLEKMMLLLKPSAQKQAALDALVAAQQKPGAAEFHRWVTPEDFGARFGADAGDVAQVTAWLEGHGFSVDEVAAGRRVICFSGSAAQVEDAFAAPMHRFAAMGIGSSAVEHIANVRDPEVPAALAGVVAGVVSLHDVRRRSALHVNKPLVAQKQDSRGAWDTGGFHYLYPADMAAIYDAAPLYTDGTAGKGVGIAVVGRSNLQESDVAAFRKAAGLPASKPEVILPGKDPGLVTGDQIESTLDVEWAGAMAPAAKVTLVAGKTSATTDGVDLAAAYVVNHAVAPVVSVSYAECEQAMGAAEMAFYNSLWEQAAAEGMSVFVASGDEGAAGCNAGTDEEGTQAAVNGMCSSPYATCVGGTEFEDSADAQEYWTDANGSGNGSALGYIPEQVWNESAADNGYGLWATGGGVSTVYTQPSWQTGVTANAMRTVPDVALTAAAHDGYVVIENGSQWVVSGTSAATPSFASVMALVVESQGGWQGNVNSALYMLAKAEPGAWHETASGTNSVPGVTGFAATGETYNLATGLGSVDAKVLVAKWAVTKLNPKATPQPVGIHAGPVSGPAKSMRTARAY